MRIVDRRSTRIDPQRGVIRCEYVVSKVPTWNSGTSAEACGTITSWQDDPLKPIRNECRLPIHPLARIEECDARPERSGRGLSRAQLLLSLPKLSEALSSPEEGVAPAEPRCLSCDDTPIVRIDGSVDSDAVVRRYRCLQENVARYVHPANAPHPNLTDSNVAADIVRGLKLLVEMYGEHLDKSDRERISSLYLQAPTPLCHPPPEDPAFGTCKRQVATSTDPEVSAVYARYLACQELQDHGSTAMILDETRACVAAAAAVRTAKGHPALASCADVPADFERRFIVDGLSRDVSEIPLAGDPAFDEKWSTLEHDLRRRLAAIDAWYTAAAAELDLAIDGAPLTSDQERELRARLAADTGTVLGSFWGTLLDVSPASAASGRAKLRHAAAVVERAVLGAAYPTGSDEPPLTRAPLLFVTVDALRGLADHLDMLGAAHDLGCRFRREGCASGARASTLSELREALSALNDGALLNAALSRATHLGSEPWKPTLHAIASKHGALELAARDALSLASSSSMTSAMLLEAPSHDVRHASAVVALAHFVNHAKRRHASFVGTGLSTLSGEGELVDALTPDKRALAINDLERAKIELDSLRNEFVAGEAAALDAFAAQLAIDGSNAVVAGRLEALATRFEKLTEEIVALRRRDEAEEARFGQFMTSFEKIIDEETSRADFAIQRESSHTFSLSARDARFSISHGVPTLSAIKVLEPAASFSVEAGEIVNVHVTGAWSPTCALRGLEMPDGTMLDAATLAHAMTGPEGFALTTSAQGYAVAGQQESSSTASFWTDSYSSKVCSGASWMPTIWGIGGGVNGDACDVSTSGTSRTIASSHTEGTGGERRFTASFASGIRAPNTPFPSAPAGSLIAVTTRRGQPELGASALLDVRVVQSPVTSLVIPSDADISFVVNDSAGCAPAPLGSLSLTRTSLVPLGASLKALSGPMRAAMDHITSRRAELIAQGQMLPSDSAQLLLEAQSLVAQGCRCDLGQFPRFIQQYFATWIAKEIARTERQVEITAKEYERRLVVIEAQSTRAEAEANSSVGRVRSMARSLALRNVDPTQLRGKIREVAETAVTHVRPALRLRLPAALALVNADTSIQRQANELVDLAETADSASEVALDDVARVESDFIASLIATIRAAQRSAPPPTESTVAVRIPRYVDASPGDTSAAPCVRHPRSGGAEARWTALDCVKSRSIWRQVLDTTRTTASFDLEPNDLYAGTGSASAGLLCNVSAPLISQMAMIVATDDDVLNQSLNTQHFSSRLQLGDRMVFSMTSGPETYRLVPDALGRGVSADAQVRFLFAKSDLAVDTFVSTLSQPIAALAMSKQAGFSPFTTYTFDVAGLRDQFATPSMPDAHELVLVFNVEPYPAAGGNVRGVPVCESASP